MGEILGATLASVHNIAWFNAFMAEMRNSILEGRFESFRKMVHEIYPEGAPRSPEGKGKGKSRGGPGSGPHNKKNRSGSKRRGSKRRGSKKHRRR